MPPKSKKGGLKNEQIKQTVTLVKQYWPLLDITPEMIRSSKRDFVIKFYSDCMDNLDDKLAYATRSQHFPLPSGLSEEEALYLRLSRIPALKAANFSLGDLYVFDPVRVNSFIFVIMHYLTFTDTLMDKVVGICNSVFDAKEKAEKDREELERLKQEKMEKEIEYTKAKEERARAKDEATQILPEYEEVTAIIEESKKKCKDKIAEVEKMTSEIDIIKEEIQVLEKKESELKSQIVTEEEYTRLKNSLEAFENQLNNLEEIDVNNGLIEQTENMEYLQACLRKLNNLTLPEELLNLYNYRAQVKNEEESKQALLNKKNATAYEIETMKTELENEKRSLESKNKELIEKLRILTEQGIKTEHELRKKYEQASKNNQMKILEKKKDTKKKRGRLSNIKKRDHQTVQCNFR